MSKAINPFSMVKPEKRDRLAAFASYRAEFADIAKFKMRQARGAQGTERVIELLSDWCASFV